MNQKRPIILIGGGGHCKAVIDVAEKAGYNITGILDREEKIGTNILGYPVIGVDSDILKYTETHNFHITVGQIKSSTLRRKLFKKVTNVGGKIETIVSPLAHISKYAFIGEGSTIMHNVVINSAANIGKGCIINTFANIEHDTRIEDFCHISTGAMINGECNIGQNCFVGSNSTVSNGLNICSNSFIAISSLVTKPISIEGFYAGIPARKMK